MIDTIKTEIEKHTDIYGFLTIDKYISEHKKNRKHGSFDNYAFLSTYKTIITLGFPYPKQEVKWQGKGYGVFARFSYSNDYHKVIMSKLNELSIALKRLGINSHGSVDVSKVDEKFAASLSGLGYFGKNSIIIHPRYGNYMFLATLLIDKEITSTLPLEMDCGECTKCIDACPSDALNNGFDRHKCISHLSQTKMVFEEKEISYFKNTIYGCDICLKVCPKNKGIDIHRYKEFEPNGIENVFLEDLLFMTKKEFIRKFKNNTSHWIGVSTMRRNAIALMASQNLKDYIPKIKESMDVYKDNLWYNKTANNVLKILERE